MSEAMAQQSTIMPVQGVMLDWRASLRGVRRALYWFVFMGRLFQLPRISVTTGGFQISSWSWSRLWLSVDGEDDGSVRRNLARKKNILPEGTVWQDHLFINSRGQTIFTQSWAPAQCQRYKGLVIILHGLNEHSGRYARFAKQLNTHGYIVIGMDWIGHGGSDGLHGYVESLDHAVDDTEEFLLRTVSEYPGIPVFLLGHSTGGAIVLKATLRGRLRPHLAGLILTSPAIRVKPSHPVVTVVAPLFSVILPRYQFGAANRRRLPVTRDPVEQVAKYTDPLVYTGPIRVRTGTEILRITAFLQKNLQKVSTPFFVLHGTDDKVTDPEASQLLYDMACSEKKKIKLYSGLLHDLLFEVERDVVATDIIDWLDSLVADLSSSDNNNTSLYM